jgi:tetratricopeptide (TPR) repeat protein
VTGSPRAARAAVWFARAGAVLATVQLSVGALALHAQPPQRVPGPDALQLLVVPAFVSTDKVLGCEAANEVRDRLDDDADIKKLWILPKDHIDATLKASGFAPCSPIAPTEAKQLAQNLRGDAYLDGTATKTATGVRIEVRLVLARDVSAAQPLPPAEAPKAGAAAKQISKDVQAAMKQLPGETKCFNSARDGKYPDALAAGRAAIALYPPSTLARLCIANTFVAMKAPPDSVIGVVKEILASDPHNHWALELAGEAYYEQKNNDEAVKAWSELIAADPSNTVLVEDVVTKIVQSGHADAALPIVAQAVKDNPGDPKLVGLQYRLLIVSKHYHDAIPVGEEAIKSDTSFADTLFFERQTTAYLADSQPQKAAEAASRGLAKFPSNSTLQQLQIQSLLSSGQTQQATDALKKILAANPKWPAGWEQLFTAYVNTAQPDSALWALHQAVANGDSASNIQRFALSQGNSWYRRGSANKNADTLGVAIRYLAYADSLVPSDPAKFLLGTSRFTIGAVTDQDAVKNKSCDLAKLVSTNWTQALIDLHAGASVQPQAAAQMMTTVTKYMPSVDQQVKKFCK